MSKYNVFFQSQDTVETEVFRFNFTVTAPFTPTPQGVLITVGGTATSQHVGQNVIITETGKPTWYGVITHKTDSTHIYVVPYQSALDTAGGNIFQQYTATSGATGANITSDLQIHTTLSIDLSDAPDGTYNYIIASSCGVAGLGTSVLVRPQMLSACQPGDPFYHDKSSSGLLRFQGRYHFKNGSYTASRETLEDTYMYNTVHSVSLTPGKIYEFHIAAECPNASSGASAWLRNGRIMAFRVGTFQENDKSTDTSAVTSNSTSFVSANSITLNTTDNYMFLFCCAGQHDSTSASGCQLRFRVGATTYADTTFLPVNTNNNVSFAGWIKLNSISSGTVVQLEVANTGSTNVAGITRSYICAIPLSSQTGYGFDYTSSGLLADDKKTDTDSTATMKWNEGRTSATCTQVNRRYIEVITTSVRKASGDAKTFARPFFRNGLSVGCADRGYVGPGMQWNGFWFQRTNPYLNGTTTNGIETKAAVSEGINVKVKNSFFLFLPEQDELIPDELTETTIIADVESGLQYKAWNTQTTDVYKRQISDITQISRILRNSAELAQLTSYPADWAVVATDSWYWDATNKTIYIKVPVNPANDDQTVLVVALDTYGRNSEVLYDSAGTLIPYEPRLQKVPGLQQEIEARGTQSQVSTTLGSITLPASDRAFDRKVTRRIYEGLRATIRRGYSGLSKSLDTFHVIAKGIMGMPRLDENKFEIKLYDTGLTLNRALDDQVVSVYRGSILTEGQALPIIYGTVKRVPAYRVTDVLGSGSNRNTFKISANFLVSIDSVYLDGTGSLPISVANATVLNTNDVGTKYPASAAFQGPSFNGPSGANTGWNADVLYVDVTGLTIDNVYTGTLLTKPGEIAKHILQNYPRVKTDVTGGFTTANVTAGFNQTAAVFDVSVDTNAAFSIGDVVKVREGSNNFHAYVYAKPSGKLSLATLYRPGNTNPTSTTPTIAYTTAADVDLVEKSGGLADNGLHHESFRLVDRKWRKKLSGGLLTRRNTPTIGLVLNGTESVSAALNKISQYTFIYWYVNRLGRVALGVPDFDGSNLIENPGFENFSSVGVWPHKSICNVSSRTSMGNVTLTSTKKYEGLSAAKIENKNGSYEAVPNACAIAPVVLPSPGTYAVTALVALESGNGSAVRVGLSSPNDSKLMTVSEPIQAINEEWRRVTTYITTGRGNSGLSFFRLLPYYPETPSPPAVTSNASLVHWYKADEPNSGYDLPSDNSTVSTWYDKGTNPVNLTATGAPRFIKDYCLGRSAISYDSVSDVHITISPGTYTQYSLFVVYALNDSYNGARRAACGSTGSDEVYIGTESGSSNYTLRITDSTSATINGEATSSNINTLKVHSVIVSGSGTKYFINGVQQGATDPTRKPQIDTTFFIGSATYPLNGVVCEVMLYDRAFGAASRQAVETYLSQKYCIDAAGIYLDNVEISRIAGVIDDNTADSLPLEFRDEIYPEARVTYNVNLQDSAYATSVIVTDSAAKGLTTTVSEGKNAIQTSSRLDLGTPTIVDSASASGIAAALVAYFGRLRYTIKIKMLCPYDFIPEVGMKLLNMGMTRLPTPNDDYPLFPITTVDYNEENAIQLDLAIEAQIDPVLDRGNIVADSMPLGAVLVTLDTTGTPTYASSTPPVLPQFEEMTQPADRYIAGSATVDLVNEYGNTYHTHTAAHTHNISNHTHTFSIDSIGLESIFYADYSFITTIGPYDTFSRGYDSGSHSHTGSQSGLTSSSATGNSGDATTTLTTPPGGNDPAYIRCRFFKHNFDDGSAYIPQTLYFMYESNSVPSGWTRNTSFNGYFLRGATTNTAITAGAPLSIASPYTPNDAGSYLVFGSYSDLDKMQRGKRLTVTNTTSGTKVMHVVVDLVDEVGKQVKVYPLHEDSDTSNATMLGDTTNTKITADAETASTTFSAPNHDHDNSIPTHTHTAPHTHSGTSSLQTSTAPETAQARAISSSSILAATPNHIHFIETAEFPTSPGGTISNASGSTFTDVKSQPDGIGLIFMSSPASNRLIPTGAIIFFDGNACPTGWTRYANADDLLIFGTAGNAVEAINGGHTHTFTASSHTFSHNHGGTHSTITSIVDIEKSVNPDVNNSFSGVSPNPHHHNVTGTINTNGSATLESKTLVTTSAASSKQPLHKKLLLCKKD